MACFFKLGDETTGSVNWKIISGKKKVAFFLGLCFDLYGEASCICMSIIICNLCCLRIHPCA